MVFDEFFDKSSSVSTANDGGYISFFANCFGDNGRSSGIGGVFGVAQETIPNNSFSFRNIVGGFGS